MNDAPLSGGKLQRPFVLINMAMTADGKIASANRTISSFGSQHDHEHLLRLRSRTDAVMAGARTVDLHPINMGPGPEKYRRLRRASGRAEYNLRVIVSGSASIDLNAEIFRHRFSPILAIISAQAPAAKRKKLASRVDDLFLSRGKEIDFPAALRWLREKWSVRDLLCEGGGALNSALLQHGLVDELHVTICPMIFGGRDAPTIADGRGAEALRDATLLRLKSMRRVGAELFLVYDVDPSAS